VRTRSRVVVFGVLLAVLVPVGASSQETDHWRVFAAAYGWLAGVDGTVAVGPRTEFPDDTPFNDVLENVDFALSLHLEAQQAGGLTVLGYRALSVDYESGEGRDLAKWDMVTHGLYLGLVLDL
jgi:hypothetical protein